MLKNKIQKATEYMMTLGWNKEQAKSLAWVEHFEEKYAQIEYKYQGLVWPTGKFHVYCANCDKEGVFTAPSTVRDFIHCHKGHNTKVIKG